MAAIPPLHADLLRRYDRPGPRYTSYPTAPRFTPEFDTRAFREHARRSNTGPDARTLSLYVHVPYCFSPCFYCGCNRVITRSPDKGRQYLGRLLREVEMVAPLFDRRRPVVQLHLGGGTPNFLRPHELGEVIEGLGRHFRLGASADRDFSIELDPRYLDADDVAKLAALGFNRASLGVQDFDPAVQKAVNRKQSVAETLAIIDACRAHGFRSVNVDLIYGLPEQTIEGFRRTLHTVLAARPDRLAVYGYAHLPELFKPQRRLDATRLPSPEGRISLLRLAIETLSGAGYRHVGMDHFALPDDALCAAQDARELHRNFMGYTTHARCDLIGLGVSAISHVGESFSQNPRDLPGWEAAIDAGRLPVWRGLALDADDVIRADLIQELICHGELDIPAFEARHRIGFRGYFTAALERLRPLADDGLVTTDEHRIAATPQGRLLLRTIAMCFDRYLQPPEATPGTAPTPRYSQAI